MQGASSQGASSEPSSRPPATLGSFPAAPASNFQVNAVRCVKNEIHNMLAALRHHSRGHYGAGRTRWASEERFTREILADQESPVLRAFKDLQSYLDNSCDYGVRMCRVSMPSRAGCAHC